MTISVRPCLSPTLNRPVAPSHSGKGLPTIHKAPPDLPSLPACLSSLAPSPSCSASLLLFDHVKHVPPQDVCPGFSCCPVLFLQVPTWLPLPTPSGPCSSVIFSARPFQTSLKILTSPYPPDPCCIFLLIIYQGLTSCFSYLSHLLTVSLPLGRELSKGRGVSGCSGPCWQPSPGLADTSSQ